MNTRRIYFIIIAAVFILILLVSLTLILKDKIIYDKSSRILQSVTPTTVIAGKNTAFLSPPKTVKQIPTLPAEKGYGIDTDSKIVKDSQAEIQKLNPYLPYQQDYKTKNGTQVSIIINAPQLEDNNWTLLVQIFGIDYQVTPGRASYQAMKSAFQEAANSVLVWVKNKGVEPDKLIIQWSDKQVIENKAEDWLKSPQP